MYIDRVENGRGYTGQGVDRCLQEGMKTGVNRTGRRCTKDGMGAEV